MRYIMILVSILFTNHILALDQEYDKRFDKKLDDKIERVDFDVSMGIQNKPVYGFMFRHPKSADFYHSFKKIYNSNFYNKRQEKPLIPKKMHQLWIGGDLPKFFQQYIDTCKKTNPGWEYKLWTEKDLQTLSYNKDVEAKLFSNRFDVTKDYFMHVILAKEGGVFLDVDYACFKPFDQLNHQYEAWFALEPGGWWKSVPAVNFSIIAAKPNHPIITKTLKEIERYALDIEYRKEHNLQYTNKDVEPEKIFASVQILGGKNIYEYCQNHSCNQIMTFPPTYFLPKIDFDWMLDNTKKYSLLDKVRMHFGLDGHKIVFSKIQPETIAMNDFNAKKNINPLYYREAFYGD